MTAQLAQGRADGVVLGQGRLDHLGVGQHLQGFLQQLGDDHGVLGRGGHGVQVLLGNRERLRLEAVGSGETLRAAVEVSGAAGAHQFGLAGTFQLAGARVDQGLGLFVGLGDDLLGAALGLGADALDFLLGFVLEELVERHISSG